MPPLRESTRYHVANGDVLVIVSLPDAVCEAQQQLARGRDICAPDRGLLNQETSSCRRQAP